MAGSANVILSVHSVRESFEEITGDELQLWPFPRELEGVIPHVDYLMPNRIEATPDGAPQVVALSDALGTKYGDFVVAVYEGAVPPSDEVASAEKLGVRWLTLLAEVGPRPGKHFGAEKTYGENIQLRWYPEDRRPRTTPQWDGLMLPSPR
jgi:hypothetical protein